MAMNRPAIRMRDCTRKAMARSRSWPIWTMLWSRIAGDLIAQAMVTQADGFAEREAALRRADAHKCP